MDFNNAEAALSLAGQLHGRAGMFKIGKEAFTSAGPELVRGLVSSGERVFLDLKFNDIPNTVRGACRAAAALGVSMIDVHALGGAAMMRAAIEGAREGAANGKVPKVLAITILTSLASSDLDDLGISGPPQEAALRLALLAKAQGVDGVVASAQEAAPLRRACGPDFLIVTPGIRPAGSAAGDQSRTATPRSALESGADYLVVGRPITAAPDPAAAAEAILKEMGEARNLQ